MPNTVLLSVELVSMNCPHCGGVFAISREYREEAERLGQFKQCWSCPYCKQTRGYGSGEIQKLQAQVAQLERDKNYLRTARDNALNEAGHFRASRDALKGQLTKERRRVGNGVCPCCNRSFVNLRRHMTAKHPDHAKEGSATA
jgi:ssDNA-binding Zn-finger/Zn-ribbon topoisomerase 1